MTLRKINASFSLITTLLIMYHAVFYSVWMLLRGSIAKPFTIFSYILLAFMLVHAVLSIIIVIRNIKSEKISTKAYPIMNIETYIQRICGILILLLLVFHLTGVENHFQPQLLHAVIHPVFFAAVLGHTSVSCSRALITLGIGNAAVVKGVNTAVRLLCVLIFALSTTGFFICLYRGVII